MKKILFLLLTLLFATSGTLTFGQTVVNLTPGQNVAQVVQAQPAGTVIRFAAGSYDCANFDVPVGVSLEGVLGSDGLPASVLRFSQFEWWRGCVELRSESLVNGNQSVKNLRFDGQNAKGFTGIQVFSRTDIAFSNIYVTGFYHAGIELVGTQEKPTRNISISDFQIINSSRESGGYSVGNLLLSGYHTGTKITKGRIVHDTNVDWGPTGEKSSGYAIKFQPYYAGSTDMGGKLTNVSITYVTEVGKPGAKWGNNVPNISFEFLEPVENLEIAHCTLTTHISLEHNYDVAAGVRTAWVHDNVFKVQRGQSLELDLSNALIENNTFDYSVNTNGWCWMGNFNGSDTHKRPVKDLVIRKNTVNLASHSPRLYSTTVPLTNFTMADNQFSGTGKPLLIAFDRPSSNGSRGIAITGNRFPTGGYNEFAFAEGAVNARPPQTVVGGTPAPPPSPTPPRVDTVYVPRPVPVYYYDSVYTIRDTVSKTIIFKYKTVKR